MTSIVKKTVRNPEIVKDLTQEIFIRAYLNYDCYTEDNKIQAWLSVIARNKLKDYYKTEQYHSGYVTFSPPGGMTDTDFRDMSDSPEDIVTQKDFTDRIIAIINTLPPKQRDVIMYSYFYDYSESEIAKMQNIPVGSVKSAKHYGLEKVKKLITDNNLVTRKAKNNMNKLTKQEAYSLLYQYAKNQISNEDKTAVEEYMKTDGESKNIAEALRQLHPKLTYAREDETTHHQIEFRLNNGDRILHCLSTSTIEDYQRRNEYLQEHDGYTPENEKWFQQGYDIGTSYITIFDNEGNKIESEEFSYNAASDHHRIYMKRMNKVFPVQYTNTVYYTEKKNLKGSAIEKSEKAPNLYEAKTGNFYGNNVKSALYLALPEKASNIRMIRGNGVIDCGTYKFIYADRYVTADEGIFAECTFNM